MTQATHKPVRIQLRRGVRGWRLPADGKSVARPHRWSNPYAVEIYGREEAVRLFEDDVMRGELAFTPKRGPVVLLGTEDAKRELRGWLLACFCSLDELCHADVLLRIANEAVDPGNYRRTDKG